MMKKLAVICAVILLLGLMVPASASAAENQIIYGTIVSVDKEKNEIVVTTEDGTQKTISLAGAGMQIGPDNPLTIDDLQPGKIVGTLVQVSGNSILSEKLTIVPELPLYKHMTGVVTSQQENGFMFQTKEGEIPCNLPEGMEGMGVGEAFFAIAEIPAGNDITMITGFEPLEDTIETIGSNMKNMGSNSLLKPEQVAVRMVNELGAMTQNVPEQTKTWLQAKLGETIETSMPDEAWMNMNREAVQNMNAEGAGFIPPAAFGQMPVDVFGQMELEAFSEIPVKAFGVMSTEAFQNMPDGAFDVMKPEAFGQIPSDVKAIMAGKGPLKDVPTDLVNTDPDLFYQMADQAFHDFWIKHDVPLGEDGLPVPTYPELPGNPGAPTPGEPGAGAPPQGTGVPGSGGTGTPTDPNNPPAGENPEQPGQPQQPQQPTEQQPGNPPPPPPPPPAPPSPPGP